MNSKTPDSVSVYKNDAYVPPKKIYKKSKIGGSAQTKLRSRPKNLMNTPNQYTKKKDDWNTKMRMKREEREEELGIKRQPNIASILADIHDPKGYNNKEGYEILKEKLRLLDEQAKMKEKVLESKGNDPEGYNEVNNLIITSIKAKLYGLLNMTS
jgi:hypothetical protein